MSVPFVDLQAQYLSIKEEIDQTIQTCLDSNQFVGGNLVVSFEEQFAEYIGIEYCIGCANGTDALELALKALEIGEGDEVLVPAHTWIATAGAVSNVGASPVFVDILEDEFTIDPSLLEANITEKTKAIIPVHLYGLPARMNEIMSLAEKRNLLVIEDAAQAVGASVDGKKVGTFGDIATFSFYPGKNLGAYGDAGAVITNDTDLAERVRRLGNHGQLVKHQHGLIGRNSRLDSLQAAILLVKLKYLEDWTENRIAIAKQYDTFLSEHLTPIVPAGYRHVYHVYAIQAASRNVLMAQLKANGIGCAIHYPNPVPLTDAYAYLGHDDTDFPVSRKVTSQTLSLPMYAELPDVSAIAKALETLNG